MAASSSGDGSNIRDGGRALQASPGQQAKTSSGARGGTGQLVPNSSASIFEDTDESDYQNTVELTYEGMCYLSGESFFADEAKGEIVGGLLALGIDEDVLAQIDVQVTYFVRTQAKDEPPAAIARIRGSIEALADLQGFPLAFVRLMGKVPCEVKVGSRVREHMETIGQLKQKVYKVGDEVEVFSNSYGVWGPGVVYRVRDGIVTSDFELPGGGLARKDLPASHSDLRPKAATSVGSERRALGTSASNISRRREEDTSRKQPQEQIDKAARNQRSKEVREIRRRKGKSQVDQIKRNLEVLGASKIQDVFGKGLSGHNRQQLSSKDWGALALNPGDLVWYSSAEAWRPCKVEGWSDGNFKLANAQGEELLAKSFDDSLLLPGGKLSGSLVDDLNLERLDAFRFEFALRRRFCNAESYTTLGDVMIFINPYRTQTDGQQAESIRAYADRDESLPSLPPHAYSIAAKAYSSAVDSDPPQDQAIFLIGEPCTGKSRQMGLMLEFLTGVKGDQDSNQRIQSALAMINPFVCIPCFTDDDSSMWRSTRACVAVDLLLDEDLAICKTEIDISVLEASRAAANSVEAMTFEAFYFAMKHKSSGAWIPEGFKPSLLGLYADLPAYDIENRHLSTWENAIRSFGFRVEDIVRVLCGIMHLNELYYMSEPSSDRLVCSPQAIIAAAARSLGVDQQRLVDVLSGPEIGGSPSDADKHLKAMVIECYRRVVAWVTQAANKRLANSEADAGMYRIRVVEIPSTLGGISAAKGPDAMHLSWVADAVQMSLLSGAVVGRSDVPTERSRLVVNVAQTEARPWDTLHRDSAAKGWITRAVIRLLGWSSSKIVRGITISDLRDLRHGDEGAQETAKDLCGMISGTVKFRPWILCCLRPNEQIDEMLVSRPVLLRQIYNLRLLDITYLSSDSQLVVVWPLEVFCKQYAAIGHGAFVPGMTRELFAKQLIELVRVPFKLYDKEEGYNMPKDEGYPAVAASNIDDPTKAVDSANPKEATSRSAQVNSDQGPSKNVADSTKAVEPQKALPTFKPGEMGMAYDDDGVVQEVSETGQAHSLGIKKGDRIEEAGTWPDYSKYNVVSPETGEVTASFQVRKGTGTLLRFMLRTGAGAAREQQQKALPSTSKDKTDADAQSAGQTEVGQPHQDTARLPDQLGQASGADDAGDGVDDGVDDSEGKTVRQLSQVQTTLSTKAAVLGWVGAVETPEEKAKHVAEFLHQKSDKRKEEVVYMKLEDLLEEYKETEAEEAVGAPEVSKKESEAPRRRFQWECPPPKLVTRANGVVGSESVYLTSEQQELMDWRMDREFGINSIDEEDRVSSTATAIGPSRGAIDEVTAMKRASFLVDEFMQRPESPELRRVSLVHLSEGEQRLELLRRLDKTDLEEERLLNEGRAKVRDETVKLHEEEYTLYSSEKIEHLNQVLIEMIDAQKVAWGDHEELARDHSKTGTQLQDVRRECEHWRSEADRLWGIIKAMRRELHSRGVLNQ